MTKNVQDHPLIEELLKFSKLGLPIFLGNERRLQNKHKNAILSSVHSVHCNISDVVKMI